MRTAEGEKLLKIRLFLAKFKNITVKIAYSNFKGVFLKT